MSKLLWPLAGAVASGLLVLLFSQFFSDGNGSDDANRPRSVKGQDQRTSKIDDESKNSSLADLFAKTPKTFSANVTPFVCSDESGRVVEKFASLNESIEHLSEGGRIEIHTNGVIETDACQIVAEAPVTIAAGDGYKPVLLFAPDEENEFGAMLYNEGNLTLHGIELRSPNGFAEDDEVALIGVENSGQLKLVGCTLTVQNGGFCVFSHAAVSMENCQLHAPNSVALTIDPQEHAKTVLRNCWISGESAFEILPNQPHTITIIDCTFACSDIASIEGEGNETSEMLTFDTKRSLFVWDEAPIFVEDHADVEISWNGENNVYCGLMVLDSEQDAPNNHDGSSDFERWQQRAQETGSRHMDNPFNIEIGELADLISDVNFRLASLSVVGSISAGAKLD